MYIFFHDRIVGCLIRAREGICKRGSRGPGKWWRCGLMYTSVDIIADAELNSLDGADPKQFFEVLNQTVMDKEELDLTNLYLMQNLRRIAADLEAACSPWLQVSMNDSFGYSSVTINESIGQKTMDIQCLRAQVPTQNFE